MQNAGLDEAQAGIKIAGRNSNNLQYTDETILMAERKEELKIKVKRWKRTLLMKVKEDTEEVGLKLNIQKLRHASGFITSWQMMWKKMETMTDFIFLSSKITANGDCSHEIKRCCSLEEKLWQT